MSRLGFYKRLVGEEGTEGTQETEAFPNFQRKLILMAI